MAMESQRSGRRYPPIDTISIASKKLSVSPSMIPDEVEPLLLANHSERTGDVISPTRAVLTLSKSMFNAGCFSLPYAWKLGGLWFAFGAQIVISFVNWYGNHMLVRSSQKLSTIYKKPCLDYGHFTKKVFDLSGIPQLQAKSKIMMYVVNLTILFYQLGMCSVALLFISKNLQKVTLDLFAIECDLMVFAALALVCVWATNLYAELRVISVFALISSLFFVIGAVPIIVYSAQMPNQWASLPAVTNFRSTIMFIGMAMYAYEGQTMILPIENKMRNPQDFLYNCGVLPTTMMLCTAIMTAIGFYGYTAFGAETATTITLNLPGHSSLFTAVNICLMLQAMFGHSIAMYVVVDMFFSGFRRKLSYRYPSSLHHSTLVDKLFRTFWVFVTYLMAILIPKLDILIPLVGVTSGTLCALVYPPLFEIIVFRNTWRLEFPRWKFYGKLTLNCTLIAVGLFAIVAGVYANALSIYEAFSSSSPYAVPLAVRSNAKQNHRR